MPFAKMWVDLEIVLQSEVKQKVINKHCILSNICGFQKTGTYEPICKAEIRDTDIENKSIGTKGGKRGWDELEDWD